VKASVLHIKGTRPIAWGRVEFLRSSGIGKLSVLTGKKTPNGSDGGRGASFGRPIKWGVFFGTSWEERGTRED